MYHSFSGYPHAEGLSARTPAAAYAYINENGLLSVWRRNRGNLCLPFTEGAFDLALEQLLADGFTHVIIHRDYAKYSIVADFALRPIQPAYEDDYLGVYRLRDLPDSCDWSALFKRDVMPLLASMALSTSIEAPDFATRLNLGAVLGDQPVDSLLASAPPMLLPLAADGALIGRPIPLLNNIQFDAPLPQDIVALFVYTPPESAQSDARDFRGPPFDDFQSCERIGRSGAAQIEFFARSEFPCGLLFPAEARAASFDNGMMLGNVLLNTDGAKLDIDLVWNRLSGDPQGVSIQVFNRGGAKVASDDFVIHHNVLARHSLDLSRLEPGAYDLKLILYSYESGASVPGVAANTGQRFERALDIGRITLD